MSYSLFDRHYELLVLGFINGSLGVVVRVGSGKDLVVLVTMADFLIVTLG
jgi:hypothetical protein